MASTTRKTTAPASNANDFEFRPMGHGLMVMRKGDQLLIAVNVGPDDKAKAPVSSTGKMRFVGQTGGWLAIPGTDLRAMVQVGFATGADIPVQPPKA